MVLVISVMDEVVGPFFITPDHSNLFTNRFDFNAYENAHHDTL